MGPRTSRDDEFMQKVRLLRHAYTEKRDATNLALPNGRPIFDQIVETRGETEFWVYWFEREHDNTKGRRRYQYVGLANTPDTLSGSILRLERNLPDLDGGDYEIIGNDIRPILRAPSPPEYGEDDSEDISGALARLPQVAADPRTHFLKKAKYRSEIEHLIACQGGRCPGVPQSDHVVQLLGKSAGGELVFERMDNFVPLCSIYPLARYKTWILHLIDGLQCLHAHGIIHRDLRFDNLVFSPDDGRLLICDLEGRWGNRVAPEVSREPKVEGGRYGWTEKSDIYDLGQVIRDMVYGTCPLTSVVERKIPLPLEEIVNSCTCAAPADRPSLEELHDMVSKIQVVG